jgi:hypothetical protein
MDSVRNAERTPGLKLAAEEHPALLLLTVTGSPASDPATGFGSVPMNQASSRHQETTALEIESSPAISWSQMQFELGSLDRRN